MPTRLSKPVTVVLVAVAIAVASYVIVLKSKDDEITLSSRSGVDVATMVLNGRRAACVPYEVVHGVTSAWITNLLSAGNCPSEVAVFAQSNAMSLVDTAGKWTDQRGDTVEVPMRSPYDVPVNVFVMSGDLTTHDVIQRQNEATADVSRATGIYDNEQCGIKFSIGVIEDARRLFDDPDLLTDQCDGNVSKFRAVDSDKTARQGVNVFYLIGQSGVLGQTCLDGNSAVILISQWSQSETLAHELGHALSLLHTNDVPGMPADDLMMSPSMYPAALTTGQCFRANVNQISVLNSLSLRTEPTRVCPDSSTDTQCPPLTIHK
jgi:Metallo-peptidase family M12B Reprolysin-like